MVTIRILLAVGSFRSLRYDHGYIYIFSDGLLPVSDKGIVGGTFEDAMPGS